MKHFITLATICLLAGMTSGLAQAETPSVPAPEAKAKRLANGTQFGAWRVKCEAIAINETSCVLTQRLVASEGDRFLAEILAFWNVDQSKAYLAARVPLGVYFPSGFVLKPTESEERRNFAWQSCSVELCEALLETSDQDLSDIQAAKTMVVGYRPAIGADPLVFTLNTDGLETGMRELAAALK